MEADSQCIVGGAGSCSTANGKSPVCRHHRALTQPPQIGVRPVQWMLNVIHPILIMTGKLRPVYFSYGLLDTVLYKIGSVMEWCVPDLSPKKGGVPLERPLTWLIFLPSLLMFRFFRFIFSSVSRIFGGSRVSTTDMINWLRNFRFYIRSIRSAATKAKDSKDEELENERRKKFHWKIYYFIKDLIIVKPFSSITHSSGEESQRKRSLSPDEGFTDDELTCDEMLTKYADIEDEDLEDDPNYKPEADLNSTVSSSSSSSSSLVDEEELKKLHEEASKDVSELIASFEIESAGDVIAPDSAQGNQQNGGSPNHNHNHENLNGHHETHNGHSENHESPESVISSSSTPRRIQSLSEKKNTFQNHQKRQRFQKYKAKSFSHQRMSKAPLKRQSTIPSIVITQHD